VRERARERERENERATDCERESARERNEKRNGKRKKEPSNFKHALLTYAHIHKDIRIHAVAFETFSLGEFVSESFPAHDRRERGRERERGGVGEARGEIERVRGREGNPQ
jgi:hypothetical protein